MALTDVLGTKREQIRSRFVHDQRSTQPSARPGGLSSRGITRTFALRSTVPIVGVVPMAGFSVPKHAIRHLVHADGHLAAPVTVAFEQLRPVGLSAGLPRRAPPRLVAL
jgi:hypothetical protein